MPLHKCQPGDEQHLVEVASREPHYNLFLIHNLKQGLDAHREAWQNGADGIILRNHANWLCGPGCSGAFDIVAAAAVIDGFSADTVRGLTGRPEAIGPILSHLQCHRGTVNYQEFAILDVFPAATQYTFTVRRARASDLEAVSAIYFEAGEMRRSREAVERSLPGTWVLEDGGEITCVAMVTAETDYAAMIGAVFTPIQHRNRGYATQLVHAMSNVIVESGRTACLFYHNQVAGRIYKRLGYRVLGPWMTVRFV